MMTISDKKSIEMGGVYDEGYGIIPKKVMKDSTLSIEAKAIYSFLCTYTGKGNSAYPGVDFICLCLDISKHRFYRHRKQLIEKGYMTIEKERGKNGVFDKTVYRLNHNYPHEQNRHVDNSPREQNRHEDKPHEDYPHVDNEHTISTSTISTSSKNNISHKEERESDIRELVSSYEKLIGSVRDSSVTDRFESLLNEGFTKEAIKRAYEIAKKNNAKSQKYIDKIFHNWRVGGTFTLKEIDSAAEKKWSNKNNDPTRRLKELTEEDVLGGI